MTPKKASKMELSGNKLLSSSPPSEENRKGVGGSDKANIACLPSTHPLAFSGLCGDEYVTEPTTLSPKKRKRRKKVERRRKFSALESQTIKWKIFRFWYRRHHKIYSFRRIVCFSLPCESLRDGKRRLFRFRPNAKQTEVSSVNGTEKPTALWWWLQYESQRPHIPCRSHRKPRANSWWLINDAFRNIFMNNACLHTHPHNPAKAPSISVCSIAVNRDININDFISVINCEILFAYEFTSRFPCEN